MLNKYLLTEEQKEGALLFFGKGQCGTCHTGPALNSMEFYCIGQNDLQNGTYGAIAVNAADVTHKGRGGFTGKDTELYQFKVPQLYNLKDVHFFGHGSSITTIREMVAYKNEAIPENTGLPANRMASQFAPLQLTEKEIDAITAFLTDGLYDPNLKRYVPQELPSGQCFPNNDTQSRIDRGCQ
jgi:cytochrome c peroxidase